MSLESRGLIVLGPRIDGSDTNCWQPNSIQVTSKIQYFSGREIEVEKKGRTGYIEIDLGRKMNSKTSKQYYDV